MPLSSIPKRVNRIRSFVGVAPSLSAVPGLVITAVACDNAFGHEGPWSASLGKIFGVVKVRTGTVSGDYALIDTHDLGHLVSFEEVLVQKIYDLSLVPFVPQVVVDCGSHIGLFSLLAGSRYPQASLIAYEPEPENIRMLQKQLARFGSRVKVVEAAVFDREGDYSFSVFQSNCGHLGNGDLCVSPAHEKRLLVRTVDLAAEAELWKSKDLLIKIDIEGAEAQVIPRLIDHLPQSTALFLEIHGGGPIRDSLRQLLANAGFDVMVTRLSPQSSDWFALRRA